MSPAPAQLPWYRQTGYTVLFLLFFFPLGLVLMWWNSFWSLRTRKIITGIIAAIVLIELVAAMPARHQATAPDAPAAIVKPAEPVHPALPPEPPHAALPPLVKGVVLTVELSFGADHKATVSGDTNLPDGTELMIDVKEPGHAGAGAQSRAAVFAGRYTAGGIGPEGGYRDGKYLAEVVMPAAVVQPDAVRAVIGAQGEKLTGKLVVKDDIVGPTVVAHGSAVLGGAGVAAPQAPKKLSKPEVQAMVKELELLLRQGREMDPLRNPSEDDPDRLSKLRRCGELMRERQARASELRTQAEGLPDSVPYLGIAATNLSLCVSCSANLAAQNCSDAADALRQGKAQLAKASW